MAACQCKTLARTAAGDGIVRVSRETKGRGGKAVTLVRGLPLDESALAVLGKRLRSACGAGGTQKDGVIEVQGEHVDRLLALLQAEGWRVKRSGG
jgi:translation initiation factor 1